MAKLPDHMAEGERDAEGRPTIEVDLTTVQERMQEASAELARAWGVFAREFAEALRPVVDGLVEATAWLADVAVTVDRSPAAAARLAGVTEADVREVVWHPSSGWVVVCWNRRRIHI